MFSRSKSSSCLMALMLLVQTSLPSLTGGDVASLRADDASSRQTAPTASTGKVLVCVPQDLVERQGWDKPTPGSKMSSFKDLLAEFIRAHGNVRVQYRVKPRAFEDYDPAAQFTHALSFLDEVTAGQACPASTEAYDIKVASPPSAPSTTERVSSVSSTPRQYDSLAQKCNASVADPGDPKREGAGIPLDRINVAEALPACEQAAAQRPIVSRFVFLYGRALQAAERFPEAANQYLIAAQAGEPLAAIQLAGLYYEGVGVPRDYQQAARYCRQSAEAGVPSASYYLGFLYREGQGVPRDYTEAARWFLKAGDAGFPDAYAEAGRLYILGTPQDFAKAAAWFQKAIEKKSGLGALNLGLLYEYGTGVQQNFVAAVELYRQAAQQGVPAAMYRLGVMYGNGEGIQRDDAAAAKWFYEAAKKGHAEAQSELGYMFYNGLGTKQDYQSAFAWYIQAAKAGVVFAEDAVACMYERGEGVKQDDAEAVAWFRRAAEQNDLLAMTQLAVHLRRGSGVPWSEAEAMQWFRKAAEKGYAPAQSALGYGYMWGLGQAAGQGQRDYRQAAHWVGLAARQREGYAELNLAILYEKGWGVSQDLQKAKEWYLQAARSNIPEVAKTANELVSTGPFARPNPGGPAGSPPTQRQEDWVGPALGIAVTVAGLAALASFLSGPSNSSQTVPSSSSDAVRQTDYRDYVAEAVQNNIAREAAERQEQARQDRADWERAMQREGLPTDRGRLR